MKNYQIIIIIYIISLFLCRYMNRLRIKEIPKLEREKYEGLWIFMIVPMYNTINIFFLFFHYLWLVRWKIWNWFNSSDLYLK